MRIIYFDIDALRPDHLGCYGYLRPTSPNIDRLAAQGVRFENVFVSDAPCLPSRTALMSGRFGIHTGVVGHGGTAADPWIEGAGRGHETTYARTNWVRVLRDVGLHTATIGPFAERFSAWHWCAGFHEVGNTGRRGLERADEIAAAALEWLSRQGRREAWFLHVNFWDLHAPYRTPAEYGEPFADFPTPEWLTEAVRSHHWTGCGPHSAQEVNGFSPDRSIYGQGGDFPRQPTAIDSPAAVRQLFDGYDTALNYVDRAIGRLLAQLDDWGILDQTVILVGADHGENLGELNSYGDHSTADLLTGRVPLIVRWPGITGAQAGRVDRALHYQFDFTASLVEMLGAFTPDTWDGVSFADEFRRGEEAGRAYLVVSQGAGACQRAVRFSARGRAYLCLRTWHDGFRGLPDVMLFDVERDPHEQNNLAEQHAEVVQQGLALLEAWHGDMMRTSAQNVDPLWTVMREGGPSACRGRLPSYLARLKATNRQNWAEFLAARYAADLDNPF